MRNLSLFTNVCGKKLISGVFFVLKYLYDLVLYLISFFLSEAVAWRCFVKKVFLKISPNLQENTSARVSFLIKLQALACNFIKKETLKHVLPCEFREIFKNIFFLEHLRWLLLPCEIFLAR